MVAKLGFRVSCQFLRHSSVRRCLAKLLFPLMATLVSARINQNEIHLVIVRVMEVEKCTKESERI